MEFKIEKAEEENCELIHSMQKIVFRDLLNKYQDFKINSGAESLNNIKSKFLRDNSIYYKIMVYGTIIGVARIILSIETHVGRLSPIFNLPKFQGMGYCQRLILKIERKHNGIYKWNLNTIIDEDKLNNLYKKIIYVRTGECERIKQNMNTVYYEKLIEAKASQMV